VEGGSTRSGMPWLAVTRPNPPTLQRRHRHTRHVCFTEACVVTAFGDTGCTNVAAHAGRRNQLCRRPPPQRRCSSGQARFSQPRAGCQNAAKGRLGQRIPQLMLGAHHQAAVMDGAWLVGRASGWKGGRREAHRQTVPSCCSVSTPGGSTFSHQRQEKPGQFKGVWCG